MASTPTLFPERLGTRREQSSAREIALEAVACWFGGLWSDAEGANDETGAKNARVRCEQLITMVYGANDPTRYERLRALEPVEVSDLKERILSVATNEFRRPAEVAALGSFLDAVAASERETMLARRAADRVKKDIEGSRVTGKLTPDEDDSMAPLENSSAFNALYTGTFGDLTHEAHTIALLCVVDRMQIAYGLTKHLKVYVLEQPLEVLFHVHQPWMSGDPHASLPPGVWLDYLETAARDAKHPIPSGARTLQEREMLARGGVLEGLSDKIRTEAALITPPSELRNVAESVVKRLDTEYRRAQGTVVHPSG